MHKRTESETSDSFCWDGQRGLWCWACLACPWIPKWSGAACFRQKWWKPAPRFASQLRRKRTTPTMSSFASYIDITNFPSSSLLYTTSYLNLTMASSLDQLKATGTVCLSTSAVKPVKIGPCSPRSQCSPFGPL